jgi:H+-translocating NAD(P) transhydrogenase subunit alpha
LPELDGIDSLSGTMRVFIPRELVAGESRVPLVPATVAKLVKIGAVVEIEAGLGLSIHRPDAEYETAGASVNPSREAGLAAAELVLRLRKPPLAEIASLRRGTIHISYLDPFNEHELVSLLATSGVSAISKEMIPRSTVAQKMDALSSQANLAGYSAVILAAERLNKIFPMMTTPAGTIRPVKVFVIGVGVAGLQAIATAKRLGAQVEAFDTRPVVEDQVKSLGATFVKIDLGETGQTAQGYAKELTPEQLEKQREVMAQHCAAADVVITTAQVFGKRAPRLLTRATVERMRPGSVVVDLAVESGGNVESSRVDEEVDVNGVLVIGVANLPGRVAAAASEMYSNNIGNFVEHFWDKEARRFGLDLQSEILKGCLITHGGEVVHPTIRELIRLQTEANSVAPSAPS